MTSDIGIRCPGGDGVAGGALELLEGGGDDHRDRQAAVLAEFRVAEEVAAQGGQGVVLALGVAAGVAVDDVLGGIIGAGGGLIGGLPMPGAASLANRASIMARSSGRRPVCRCSCRRGVGGRSR